MVSRHCVLWNISYATRHVVIARTWASLTHMFVGMSCLQNVSSLLLFEAVDLSFLVEAFVCVLTWTWVGKHGFFEARKITLGIANRNVRYLTHIEFLWIWFI